MTEDHEAREAIGKLQGGFNQLIAEAANKERERQASEHLDAQKEIVSYAFEKAQAYNRVVILGGYVGFFTAWGFVRTLLSDTLMIIAALLMTVSVAIFVFYSVYEMVTTSLQFMRDQRAVALEPIQFLERAKKREVERKDSVIRTYLVWVVVFFLSVAAALGAAGIFFYALVFALVRRLFGG